MVLFLRSAVVLVVGLAASSTDAFQPQIRPRVVSSQTRLQAIAINREQRTPSTLRDDSAKSSDSKDDQDNMGAMMDLTGIAVSGLKGQALSLTEYPSAKEIRAVIPRDCFQPETKKSLKYLSVSAIGTALCTAAGVSLLSVISPSNILTWPLWAAYSAVTGTVAMGLWVLAHECGHGAFSKNKTLQDAVGYFIHSVMLVPYHSWQRSHAVHHLYTNHMELGETHVPEAHGDEGSPSLRLRGKVLKIFGKKAGMNLWGSIQGFLHLLIGWPAYLMIGATGGPARGMTNHFWPNPLTTPEQPNKELFPGNWKKKVLKSDIGVAAVVAGLAYWAFKKGIAQVMALYGGPLIVVNAWLVIYTWLQHTDVDVPHFSHDNHSYVKGALHTIDRPYDKLDPWGLIDFLHHKIGTTHVAHHFDSTIPHYKAEVATNEIKKAFPEFYLYEPTPIPQAIWRVAKGCTAVEKRGDKWVWNNVGVDHLL